MPNFKRTAVGALTGEYTATAEAHAAIAIISGLIRGDCHNGGMQEEF